MAEYAIGGIVPFAKGLHRAVAVFDNRAYQPLLLDPFILPKLPIISE